ncbi:hypothetical protein QuyetLC_24580 [Bacillus anthracis]|uniref:WxL domain-containing protein n=1 Tax=Bacillus anthracis TaxID=1392 RepID=A0A640MMK5_BACAN|nr:hypothetical protein QuyetLC_24580 [Bacillus anthracis]
MKKTSLVLLSVGVLSTGGLLLEQTAHAEESSVTTTVNAGPNTIKSVDAIEFEKIILNGEEQKAEDTRAAKVAIEDFRGSETDGWTLTAQLKDAAFDGLTVSFAPQITKNSDIATAKAVSLTKSAQEVAGVSDDKIKDTAFDTEVTLNASLKVPANTKAKTYTSTIVWNLQSGPGTGN